MLTLLALLGSALAVPLSVPLSPLSPIIQYDPVTTSGDEADGWSWTIPKVEWKPPMLGEGAGLNVSRANAKFKTKFTGTGMFLNGSATANTTIIRMWDDKELTAKFEPYTFAGAYKVNLDADGHGFGQSGEHSWGLRLVNGSLAVDNIVVQTQIEAAYTAGREASEHAQEPVLNNTKKNPQYNWEGEWDWVQQFDPGRFDDKQPHARAKPGASVWWQLPEGAAYMVIGGFVGHEAGTYEVELAPKVYDTAKWAYNASRPFELITQLFISPLDPKKRYTAWLRNTDKNATLKFRQARYKFTNQDAADKFKTLTAELPHEDKKKNVGAIVGGTIGGVVGVALIALGVFLFLRSRRVEEPTWDDTQLDLTEEPQVMVPCSQAMSPRESRTQSDSSWRNSLTSALALDPKGRQEPRASPPRVQQESDAGTIVVPPSYDPAWAGEGPRPGMLRAVDPASPSSAPSASAHASPVSPAGTDAMLKASPDTSGASGTGASDDAPQRFDEKAHFVAELSAAEQGRSKEQGSGNQ